MEPIYLDHAATTPLHPTVIQAMTENMQTTFGNPSSIHQFGRKAHGLLEEVRQTIAESLQAKPTKLFLIVVAQKGITQPSWQLLFLVKRKENILLLRQLNIPLCYERWNT